MTDFGPLIDARGRPRFGPRDIDIADRADPDRPDTGRTQHLVRGARRHDAVAATYGVKSAEWRAAERFRDDCAQATGARLDGARAALRVQPGAGYPEPSQAVVDALQRARGAWSVIGMLGNSVACECILGSMSLRTFDRTYHLRHGVGARRLADVLGRLVGHYETLDNAGSVVAASGHATKRVSGTAQD